MFREMRRAGQLLPRERAEEILRGNTSGVLALRGDQDYPYAVPMSYVYRDGKLYFHAAKAGHKVDAVRNWDKASFCVIDQDQVAPERYTTFYRSVIAFGKIRILEDAAETRRVATMLAMKYAPAFSAGIPAEIESSLDRMLVLEMTVEHMTAKEAIELIRAGE